MRDVCEKCGTATPAGEPALICSFECTFCTTCAEAMERACPNCGDELVARPRRIAG